MAPEKIRKAINRNTGSMLPQHLLSGEGRSGKPHSVSFQAIQAEWPHSRSHELSEDLAARSHAGPLEDEEFPHVDLILLDSGNFTDAGELARAIGQPRAVDHHLDRGSQHLP